MFLLYAGGFKADESAVKRQARGVRAPSMGEAWRRTPEGLCRDYALFIASTAF